MGWGAFLLAMVAPIVKRLLLILGVGWITYKGLDVIGGQIKAAVIANFNGFTGDAAEVFFLCGIGTAVGVVLAAFAVRLAMMVLERLGKVS